MPRKIWQKTALMSPLIVIAASIGSGHSANSKVLASTMTPLAFNAATNATTMSTDASANECITETRFVPTLCSDNEAFLLNLRASIVNEKVLCGNNPFFLTTCEKRNPGGGAIAVSTAANNGGLQFVLTTTAPKKFGDVLVAGRVTLGLTFRLKDGVSRGRILELVNDVNSELSDKFTASSTQLVVTRDFHFKDTLEFDELSYQLGQAVLMWAVLFTEETARGAIKELRGFLEIA